jgi:methylase of polypeptide subunit release factors
MLKRVRSFSIIGFTVRLVMDSKVYPLSFTTRLIAENLPDLNGLEVLDLGTGSGILAVIASKLGARKIIATDISKRALANASINLKINNIENVGLRYGSLYQPVEGETLDVIISNPPMTPSIQPSPRYTWGGADGRIILDKTILGRS